jgi:hypothetical protein
MWHTCIVVTHKSLLTAGIDTAERHKHLQKKNSKSAQNLNSKAEVNIIHEVFLMENS